MDGHPDTVAVVGNGDATLKPTLGSDADLVERRVRLSFYGRSLWQAKK